MKNIWIFNHYATNMFFEKGGRHYSFAKILKERGYNPVIFCASTNHNTNENVFFYEKNRLYEEAIVDDIPFVFIKTPSYKGNGRERILNMVSFFRNLKKISKPYSVKKGNPDIIIASSVHPLTMVAGIKIARKFNIKCITEVRDLWPESLVAYSIIKRNSLVSKLLFRGEKWIYKKSDQIIMTWPGGKQYIIDKNWDNEVNIEKVKYIPNGTIIKKFDSNSENYKIVDEDLENKNYKNIVYAGSIRKVNNLNLLIDAAKIVQKENSQIRFLIYGDGTEKAVLEKKCVMENIDNVIFKGKVKKCEIPYILKNSYANILHNTSTILDRYGQSQNKFFEYLASGKCVIQTYTNNYSILDKYDCGFSAKFQTDTEIANIILLACRDEILTEKMGKNARKQALKYDFNKLTDELISTIKETEGEIK